MEKKIKNIKNLGIILIIFLVILFLYFNNEKISLFGNDEPEAEKILILDEENEEIIEKVVYSLKTPIDVVKYLDDEINWINKESSQSFNLGEFILKGEGNELDHSIFASYLIGEIIKDEEGKKNYESSVLLMQDENYKIYSVVVFQAMRGELMPRKYIYFTDKDSQIVEHDGFENIFQREEERRMLDENSIIKWNLYSSGNFEIVKDLENWNIRV